MSKKISELPAATEVTADDLLPIVQGGATKKISAAGLLLSTGPVLVTAAELKDLVANPKTIIPAPGVGKAIWPVSAYSDYKFGTVAYTGAGGGMFLEIGVGNAINTGGIDDNLLIDFLTSRRRNEVLVSAVLAGDSGALQLANYTSDLTLGDGTLTITVLYQIITLS